MDAGRRCRQGLLLVGCGGGTGWAPSVMEAGLPGVLTRTEVEGAFTELLANPKYHDELSRSFLPDGAAATPWRVLRVDGDSYTLGLGRWTGTGPEEGATVLEIRGHRGAWTWQGGGDCHLAPVLASGNDWVHVTRPTGGLDRASRDPAVGVTEDACSGGRNPRPYLHAPVVHETATTVTVYWTTTPPEGLQSCVGVRPVDVPLHLAQPLGSRTLLDGSTFPPTPVGRPSAAGS